MRYLNDSTFLHFRSHRTQPIASDIARSVVGVCVCVLVYGCRAHEWALQKTAEPIEMPFGELTHEGPRNHVLDRDKVKRIHSQPQKVTKWSDFHQNSLTIC